MNDWYRSLKTIHCYLETKGLIVDNKVDVNRTNAHLKDDYPVKESVLGACSNTRKYRRDSHEDIHFFTPSAHSFSPRKAVA